jgi:Sulfotransferase domain
MNRQTERIRSGFVPPKCKSNVICIRTCSCHPTAQRSKLKPVAFVASRDLFALDRCAHYRNAFGIAGWGRITIGLYALFIEKWLEHFAPEQFLITRLEDYEKDPKAYMTRIFKFLDLPMPDDWEPILAKQHANANHNLLREPILPETEDLLRNFYLPFNRLLVALTKDDGYMWELPAGETLRKKQELEYADLANRPPLDPAKQLAIESHRRHDIDLGHLHNQHGIARHFEHDGLEDGELLDGNRDQRDRSIERRARLRGAIAAQDAVGVQVPPRDEEFISSLKTICPYRRVQTSMSGCEMVKS